MDIVDKQQTDIVRRILNAMGTDRGNSNDVGIYLSSTEGMILTSTWMETDGAGVETKYIVETQIMVTTKKTPAK